MFSYPPGREPRRRWWAPPEDIHEQALRGWSPSPGKLQKLLQMPEYNLFRGAPVFESNFLQVTKNGQFVNIHKHPNVVTIGILASSPRMLLPDLMIIAREKQGTANKKQRSRALEITRLIPLDLVEIFVCDVKKRQLKVQLATRQRYYLQLSASEGEADLLFERWVRLIYLMHLATGKIKTPENFPSKKTELHTIWQGSALQANLMKRLAKEQVPHSAPKLKKQSEAKQSAKVQAKLLKHSPSKWTSLCSSPAWVPDELKHSEAFTFQPIRLTAAAALLKNVRQHNLEKEKHPSAVLSESNPIPVTLEKSKKEICLLQRSTMASSSKQSPKAIGKKEPTLRDSSPGPSKSPGPPSQGKEGPAVQSQSPKHSQPAARVEPKARPLLVAADPSKEVHRKPKVGSENISVAPFHLANQSQNRINNTYSGEPSKVVRNKPESFSNFSPEREHPTSQEKESGQQVLRVPMSVAVGTSQVIWKTVAMGPSAAIDPDLRRPPNNPSSANKSQEEPRKARGKKEIPRSQGSEPKNRVKTIITKAKQKSSLKFVTLYSILSSSVERLKNSKSKAGTKARLRSQVKSALEPQWLKSVEVEDKSVEDMMVFLKSKTATAPALLKELAAIPQTEMQSVSAATLDTSKKKPAGRFTAPFDPRFPFTNQTRNCYQNYVDYYRCLKIMKAKGKDVQKCEWYHQVFTSLCPSSWVNQWDEQRKLGTFPGKI